MTGPDDVDRLAQVRALRVGNVAGETPDCLDDHTIAALADGSLATEARAAGLAHIATCQRCRRAVASVARALADPDLATEVRRVEAPPRRRWVGPLAVAVAAAAVVLLLAKPPETREPEPLHRAAPITAAPAPEAVWPVGVVSEVRSLRWTPVPGADRYRVTLFDADGVVRYETELDGTVTALPDSVLPVRGGSFWWKVDARLGFDRWAASPLIEFSIVERPQ